MIKSFDCLFFGVLMSEGNKLDVSDKFRLIRTRMRLTQKEFAALIGIPYGSYQNYERGIRRAIGVMDVIEIFEHKELKKYLVWFMTGTPELEVKQENPE